MIDDTQHTNDPYSRQINEYFRAWGRALQQAVGAGQDSAQVDGFGPFGGAAAAGGPWLQAIHQLARQALEQELDSAGITAAWRQILQQGLWPDMPEFSGLFGSVAGQPAAGFDAWLENPAFGPLREHLQRWQQMGQQQQQAQAELTRWQQLLGQLREAALQQFEQLLRRHEAEPLADARALLDLWVQAAEQAWAQAAMGEDFARALAQLNQVQLDLLQTQQAEAERVFGALGIASRRELNQAYQRIDALERMVRQLLAAQPPAAPQPGSNKASTATKSAPKAKTGARTASKAAPAVARKRASAAAKPASTKPAATKSTAATSAPAKRAATKAAGKPAAGKRRAPARD